MKAKDIPVNTYVTNSAKEIGNIVDNEVSDKEFSWYPHPERDDDTDDEMVKVKWTNYYRKGGGETIENINSLSFPPKELEVQWNKAIEKMNEAAASLKEANQIMDKTDQSLRDLYNLGVDGVENLFNELDEAGWQSSTMSREC